MQKQQIINDIKDYCAKYSIDLKKFSRDILRASHIPQITEHVITKVFGSFTKFKDELINADVTKVDVKDNSRLEFVGFKKESDNCFFNPTTKDYVFDFTKVANIANVITIKQPQLLAILQDYSNFDKNPLTVSEIALKHKIPTFILEKVLSKLKFRHASLPVTNSYIAEVDDESKIAQDLSSLKRFRVAEKFNHLQWKEIQADALKWNQFEQSVYNPIKDIITSYELPKILDNPSIVPSVATFPADSICVDETFIVTLSDLHFGSFADKNSTYYSNKNWTMESAQRAIESYILQISSELYNKYTKPANCVVISLGDILHSLTGFTDKGTALSTCPKGVTQFKETLDSLTYFFRELLRVWNNINPTSKIQVKAVSGNHDSFGDWVLFTVLSEIFKDVIDFEIASERWLTFRIGSNLCVMEHGYAAKYNSKVPQDDKGKENYIQKLIVDKLSQQNYKGPILNRYFFMGDRHHYSQKEMSSFEFIQLPSIVGSDEYADNLNLTSRSRQLGFLMNNTLGITSVLNFYLD